MQKVWELHIEKYFKKKQNLLYQVSDLGLLLPRRLSVRNQARVLSTIWLGNSLEISQNRPCFLPLSSLKVFTFQWKPANYKCAPRLWHDRFWPLRPGSYIDSYNQPLPLRIPGRTPYTLLDSSEGYFLVCSSAYLGTALRYTRKRLLVCPHLFKRN